MAEPQIQQVTIDRMTVDDLTEVLDMCETLHAEAPHWNHIPFDRDFTAQQVCNFLFDPSKLSIVLRSGREVAGCVGAYVTPFIFSPRLMVEDRILYVKSEHRGYAVGAKAIQSIEDYARINEAHYIQLTATAGESLRPAEALFEGSGYNQIGSLWRKEV